MARIKLIVTGDMEKLLTGLVSPTRLVRAPLTQIFIHLNQ